MLQKNYGNISENAQSVSKKRNILEWKMFKISFFGNRYLPKALYWAWSPEHARSSKRLAKKLKNTSSLFKSYMYWRSGIISVPRLHSFLFAERSLCGFLKMLPIYSMPFRQMGKYQVKQFSIIYISFLISNKIRQLMWLFARIALSTEYLQLNLIYPETNRTSQTKQNDIRYLT